MGRIGGDEAVEDVGLVDIEAQGLVHRRGVDDLALVEDAVGVPQLFEFAHQLVAFLAVDEGDEFAAEAAVAMFAAEAAPVFADEGGGGFGHEAEFFATFRGLDVDDGSEMEFAGADVAIKDTVEIELVEQQAEIGEVVGQASGGYGGVLYHANGFSVALHAAEDTESGLSEVPDTGHVGAESPGAAVGLAELRQIGFEGIGELLHVGAAELGDDEGVGIALDEESVGVGSGIGGREL